ncbi:tRNA lysidine(34) synthetase TilS [Skermania sp. ID1734]|uniref:tRNA lysidine(34) synthetase TilS n=1 Tax=Skermania sp. ID1734 TaxID=2597516 RepID=UPI00117EC41F|nr:tRNA lysidine(34) synthetase TilS [Skermania sp. ID1734]TSD95593.1 tRNA lysidine(34) synthetase TilS [Skermania sp. ID1734]
MDRPSARLIRLPETGAILQLRHAVRAWLRQIVPNAPVCVAVSGGADSLALVAAAVAEAPAAHALIVDHGLQQGSGEVARDAAATAERLGCASARVLPVTVTGAGGLEAAARRARYGALEIARDGLPVLLGHTLDDQAETVLLGLARGSGPRSMWGMQPWDPPWGRPLLGVGRAVTRQACADLGVVAHEDPHNECPDFVRVRLRHEVLPLLEDVLGGGVAAALARTGEQLRADGAVLDGLAQRLIDGLDDAAQLPVSVLRAQPAAIRRRAIRLWLLGNGAKALTSKHLHAVDELVVGWRGQGGVAVGGGVGDARLVVTREHGRLSLGLDESARPSVPGAGRST